MSKETDDGGKTCIHSTYDKCMYGALVKHMKNNTPSEDGCTVPWVMDGELNATTKICKNAENINTTFWIAWNRVTNQLNDCPVPCETLLVTLGAKNYEVLPRPRPIYCLLHNTFNIFARDGSGQNPTCGCFGLPIHYGDF